MKKDGSKGRAVQLSSIHLDIGFHCVDCHWAQDMHGNGHIYGEVAQAVEVDCRDCHGTADKYPTLRTSDPRRPGGMDMSLLRTQDGRKRFEWREGKLYQRSAMYPELEWEMSLVKDTVSPGNAQYNEKAARALMHAGAAGQDGTGPGAKDYAHPDEKMTCFTCHLSWTTSCGGCHLPIQANWKPSATTTKAARRAITPPTTRKWRATKCSTQLGSTVPPRAAASRRCARPQRWCCPRRTSTASELHIQQPPVAASGFSSQAFAPHYPHTERKTETKGCSDCHVSDQGDNNAIMAQVLLHGTNFVNFVASTPGSAPRSTSRRCK